MRELLAALDGDTPDRASALLATLAPLLPAGVADMLGEHIDNFDFRAAEALVRQAVAQLGMALEE